MTHKELVERASNWLLKTKTCPVVLYEMEAGREIPDAMGWKGPRRSFLIECKRSVSDFKKDFDKPFRQDGKGVGNFRYYFTPPKLLKVEEIPDRWGLLECHSYQVRVIKEPVFIHLSDAAKNAETGMMWAALRRQSYNIQAINSFLTTIWPLRGVFNGAFPMGEIDENFDVETLLGATMEDAVKVAERHGYVVVPKMQTGKQVSSRLQVEVIDNIVKQIFRG